LVAAGRGAEFSAWSTVMGQRRVKRPRLRNFIGPRGKEIEGREKEASAGVVGRKRRYGFRREDVRG